MSSETTPSDRAADALFRRFREMINSGELRDGEPLPPEREIVRTFGVSRTVVRETVLALSNSGLVYTRPRHRPVVRKPCFDTAMTTIDSVVGRLLREPGGVQNLFETRAMIESALARQAALIRTDKDIECLSRALDANSICIDDDTAFFTTDMAFHSVIFEIPGNPLFPAIQRAYVNWLEPQWPKMPMQSDRNARNFAFHEAIFEGIKKGCPDAAEKAMTQHMTEAWAQVSMTFDSVNTAA